MASIEATESINCSKQRKTMISRAKTGIYLFTCSVCLLLISCNNDLKNDYYNNSPTSGLLRIYYDEGLELHVKNQAITFESQYERASVNLFASTENDAVRALYNDSCEIIILSRPLTVDEQKLFQSKDFFPKFSLVAKSGVALITNLTMDIDKLSYQQVLDLLTKPFSVTDSINQTTTFKVLFDCNNSSVVHYLKDTVLKGQNFSTNCNSLKNTIDCINYIAANKSTVAFINYAWLSDVDDSIVKANTNKIKFIRVGHPDNDTLFDYPNQSSFKLGTYPFARSVYVYRKTGDFSLAKGFESFVAGPKGQLTFLKQGLLPNRQAERKIDVNTQTIKTQ